MKYAAVAVALAATVLGQDISTGIPSCANQCINEATSGDQIAGCGQGDIECVCGNGQFLDSIACCLSDACDEDGKDKAVSFARQICSGAGVDVPDEVVCSASGASQTGDDDPEETGDSDDDDEGVGAKAVPAMGGVAGVLAAMALL